jgi:hypothetical protein
MNKIRFDWKRDGQRGEQRQQRADREEHDAGYHRHMNPDMCQRNILESEHRLRLHLLPISQSWEAHRNSSAALASQGGEAYGKDHWQEAPLMTDEALSPQSRQQANQVTAQAMRRRLLVTLAAAVVLIGGGWLTLWATGGSSTVAPAPHATAVSAASRRPSDEPSRNDQGSPSHSAAGCRPTASRSRSACRSAGGNEKALRADCRSNRETRRPAAIDRQHAGDDPLGWVAIGSAAKSTLTPNRDALPRH